MPLPKCKHNNQRFRCATLNLKDVQEFHNQFYQKMDKLHQDWFLAKHMEVTKVKRHRGGSSIDIISKYFIKTNQGDKVPVCLGAFTHILDVSRFRLRRIVKQEHQRGYLEENRDGFRKRSEYAKQRASIVAYLNTLQYSESHYCRSKSQRKYLPPDCSISKLYKLYAAQFRSEECNRPKLSYFRFIFNTQFNFGFGSPKKDVCSTCLSLRERIKVEPGKTIRLHPFLYSM